LNFYRAKDLSMLAQLRNVSLSFPDKKVLQDVSLTVYPGDRISLVGENGAGKTSLFRMLKGRLEPDSGEISFARGVRIGYLEQDLAGVDEDPGRTCMDAALEPFGPLIEVEKAIERLSGKLADAERKLPSCWPSLVRPSTVTKFLAATSSGRGPKPRSLGWDSPNRCGSAGSPNSRQARWYG